jgi:hypothetical protein
MPCRYDESAEEIEARKKASRKRIIQPYKKELDRVTRLLCDVMTEYKNTESAPEFVRYVFRHNELQEWWTEHQLRDAARLKKEAREEIKKKALEKLTLEEKRILGLTK